MGVFFYYFFFSNSNYVLWMYYSSRLGCQVEMCEDLDGITVRIPSATRNLRVDGKSIADVILCC
jgi:hypothetical protein